MQGIYPENRKCVLCQCFVVDVDAVWDSGQPYHEKCFIQNLAKEISKYEKKGRWGSLTVNELKDLQDIKLLYEKMRRKPINKDVSPYMRPDQPIFSGNTPLGLYSATRPNRNKNNLISENKTKQLKESWCDTYVSTGVF